MDEEVIPSQKTYVAWRRIHWKLRSPVNPAISPDPVLSCAFIGIERSCKESVEDEREGTVGRWERRLYRGS